MYRISWMCLIVSIALIAVGVLCMQIGREVAVAGLTNYGKLPIILGVILGASVSFCRLVDWWEERDMSFEAMAIPLRRAGAHVQEVCRKLEMGETFLAYLGVALILCGLLAFPAYWQRLNIVDFVDKGKYMEEIIPGSLALDLPTEMMKKTPVPRSVRQAIDEVSGLAGYGGDIVFLKGGILGGKGIHRPVWRFEYSAASRSDRERFSMTGLIERDGNLHLYPTETKRTSRFDWDLHKKRPRAFLSIGVKIMLILGGIYPLFLYFKTKAVARRKKRKHPRSRTAEGRAVEDAAREVEEAARDRRKAKKKAAEVEEDIVTIRERAFAEWERDCSPEEAARNRKEFDEEVVKILQRLR